MKKKIEHKIKRQDQINDGAYDGRYKTKIVPDKKKKQSKSWAKNKNGAQANLVEASV